MSEVMLVVIVTLASGETFHQEYEQPNYEYCKIKERVYHAKFSKRTNVKTLVTTCGKQYRIIVWRSS